MGRMGQARAQPAVFLFLGPLAGEHQLDFVGVPALFRRLDNEILPFLPGQRPTIRMTNLPSNSGGRGCPPGQDRGSTPLEMTRISAS